AGCARRAPTHDTPARHARHSRPPARHTATPHRHDTPRHTATPQRHANHNAEPAAKRPPGAKRRVRLIYAPRGRVRGWWLRLAPAPAAGWVSRRVAAVGVVSVAVGVCGGVAGVGWSVCRVVNTPTARQRGAATAAVGS